MSQRHRKELAWAALLIAALGATRHAAAKCTGDTVTTEIALPETLSLSRDSGWSNGRVLWQSGWVGTQAATISQCNGASEQRSWGYASSMTRTSLSSTYATTLAGVGVQVAWVESTQASPTFGAPPSRVLAWPAVSQRLPSGSSFSVPARYAIRLVKIGAIGTGDLSFASPLAVTDYGSARATELHVTGTTRFKQRACTSPDVTVELGTHPPSALKTTGDTTAAVEFELRMLDCPAGMEGISYQFSSWEAQAEPGVVAAQARQSTATGVGVRISWRDGSPLQLLHTYSSVYRQAGAVASDVAAGGGFIVPLQASLYRMPALPLVAGTVAAEVEFQIWYE